MEITIHQYAIIASEKVKILQKKIKNELENVCI